MEYQATAKYVRSATRKVRLVADAVRKLSPQAALTQLEVMPKAAARPLSLVLASALANAKQKQANTDALKIKIIEVMGGPALKRWHAVSRGQAHTYKKRMTHIRVVLADVEAKPQKVEAPKAVKQEQTVEVQKPARVKKQKGAQK